MFSQYILVDAHGMYALIYNIFNILQFCGIRPGKMILNNNFMLWFNKMIMIHILVAQTYKELVFIYTITALEKDQHKTTQTY